MNIVTIEFEGTPHKKYYFNTNLNLIVGGVYKIVADGRTNYDNHRVKVTHIYPSQRDKALRTITEAKLIQAPPKPNKPYKKIIAHPTKKTICVLWKDGTKTIMKPQLEDEFDLEKGVAMCFMKKVYQNRGCFNDAFRDVEII